MSGDPVFYSVILVLLIASITDIIAHKIPNWLTFPTAITGIGYCLIVRGPEGLLFSLGGVGVGIASMIIFYLTGGTGAGDVKLMGALGGFLGPKGIFVAFLYSSIAGGVYALILLALKKNLIETFKRLGSFLKTLIYTKQLIYVPPSKPEKEFRLRYGIAIAIGTGLYLISRT